MTRAEKAARIQDILDELYPAAPIPLAHEDPFTLLVAAVRSAQCTHARVHLAPPALFARAGTAAEMAKLPEKEILKFIRTCGLAQAKAKALKGLSKKVMEEHGGAVP